MADFENVAAIRGAKLSDLAEHVHDVLAIALAEPDEYQVGNLTMASFDFVPYALTGLSAAMQTPAAGVRATTHVTLPLGDDAGGSATAERDVAIFGAGDVLGIDGGQVVRRYPPPGSTTAEETFHAHIEFDRPELPWAFSAHTAGDRMPAWLALVVFERHEVEWEPAQSGLQPVASVPAATLPPLDEAWAWAHAQATGGSASLSARLSTVYAAVNVSRLLAARVLTQKTDYVACLVPTTEAGRNAGLGLPGGSLGPAWSGGPGRVRLPVYDRWEFRTGPDGDFPRLARRLKGVAAPWAIGRRTMDTSRPGAPLEDLGPNDAGRRQVIRCALFSPNPPPPGAPSETAAWSAARTGLLKDAIERPAVVEGTAGQPPGAIPDLPIVGPRLYARGQRGATTVTGGDWFAELNLAPVNRVVAGLGTRVVVKDQEPLMQAAWAQVGAVDKANRELALAELARQLANAVHDRLAAVDPGRLLQITRPLAARVRLDGAGLTLAGQTVRSATPPAALGGAFRRVVRATGPLARRLAADESSALAGLVASDRAPRDFTRPYAELEGIGGLSADAIADLDLPSVALALGVEQSTALASIKGAADVLAAAPSLATALTTPSAWGAPDTTFRPGVAETDRIVARICADVPADVAGSVVKSRWLGGLAAGGAVSGVDGTAVLHEVALGIRDKVLAVAPAGNGAVAAGNGAVLAGNGAHVGNGAGAAGNGGGIAGPGALAAGGVLAAPGLVGARDVLPAPTPGVTHAALRRPAGAMMLRAGAVGAPRTPTGLSPTAAGGLAGTIVRPVHVPVVAGAAPVSDRELLDSFRTPQATALATWIEEAAKVTTLDVRAELQALVDATGALKLAPTPPRDTLAVTSSELLTRLAPDRTVVDAMRGRLSTGIVAFDAFADELIRPIMAAPRFDRPMYQALDAFDREWLVPGLGTLAEPELVTLLSANDQFTEAFLVGLSDEMGRELLWREYPTDTRGTYFHRFWDPSKDELAEAIHRFKHTRLGSHVTTGPPGQTGRAVVVVRGEVVRQYPDLTVMALREQGRDAEGRPLLPEAPTGPPDAVRSLFHAMLPPDVMLAGLDISVDQLREPGWWIVIGEHPHATRFVRKEADLAGDEVRFARPGAQASGATVAADRLENPTRIAFEAAEFLPSLA
ncbi:MAG TPA: hypothetical protein VNT03_17670 [Baekduia sp.]|nr:hypothetical protein [Baekduia sp.]